MGTCIISTRGLAMPSQTEWDFAYTGDIQTFKVPATGWYMLEVWGGGEAGSGNEITPRKGGYSIGYKKLLQGNILYICCGGQGNSSTSGANCAGGYNGGGKTWSGFGNNSYGRSSGGGATHMAFVTGTLAEIGKEDFIDNELGLIVAGGAGGSRWSRKDTGAQINIKYGGAGGGTSGGAGGSGSGGTQTSGNAFGQGGDGDSSYSGGGGGLYGGRKGNEGAGGGSGWIGGVTSWNGNEPLTQSGQNNTKGKAKITLVESSSALKRKYLICMSKNKYKFYDQNNNELTDISVEGLENAYYYTKNNGDKHRIGGRIFYINENAAGADDKFYVYDVDSPIPDEDWETNVYTWSTDMKVVGAYNDYLGSGKLNTAVCLAQITDGSLWDYIRQINSSNYKGCNDWFVGSMAEYNFLKDSGIPTILDDIDNGYAWSSVEGYGEEYCNAWFWCSSRQSWDYSGKFTECSVVALRSF